MKIKYIISQFVAIFLVLITSCDTPRLNLDKGIIPIIPKNFEEVNSEYDDYNSDLDITFSEKMFSLIFSTNRNSNGDNFDFINYECTAYSSLVTGEFEIYANLEDNELISTINSNGNELGPFLLYDNATRYFNQVELSDAERRIFYASDIKGNLDIYMSNFSISNYNYSIVGEPIEVVQINTEFDDAYPTIYIDEASNKEIMYFTSNRDNKFDIYRATSNEDMLINQSTDILINNVDILNSDSDDKCPYIKGNIMIFASNRQGGYGGYDLYYSIRTGDNWSEPKNFGENINTGFDEYRPIFYSEHENKHYLDNFFNNLMIFSSNRPGGKGGFDLYYVGINKILD